MYQALLDVVKHRGVDGGVVAVVEFMGVFADDGDDGGGVRSGLAGSGVDEHHVLVHGVMVGKGAFLDLSDDLPCFSGVFDDVPPADSLSEVAVVLVLGCLEGLFVGFARLFVCCVCGGSGSLFGFLKEFGAFASEGGECGFR